MDDTQFKRLLAFLDLSWPGYRRVRKGVKKRLHRHMAALGCRQPDEYIEIVVRAPEVRRQCELLMKVGISRFFRDRPLWQMLEADLLPSLLNFHPGVFRVWSAGCAGGEEPYSFKIVWRLLARRHPHLPPLELLASDVDPQALVRAAAGIYPAGSLREVPPDIRRACFDSLRAGRRYRIRTDLASDIQWVRHDLLDDPLPGPFQIIFLRHNLLTYYAESLAVPAMERILTGLADGGILIIGRKETLPEAVRSRYLATSLAYVLWKCARPHC
jgi:chemotaxis methyl-accepting protein methylase